jgi:hypothetical protein
MKSKMAFAAFATAALFALTQHSAAQGTSGGTGAVASIPSSVVRDHEQRPGLISIMAGSTFANSNLDWQARTARPGKPDRLSKQKSGK